MLPRFHKWLKAVIENKTTSAAGVGSIAAGMNAIHLGQWSQGAGFLITGLGLLNAADLVKPTTTEEPQQ